MDIEEVSPSSGANNSDADERSPVQGSSGASGGVVSTPGYSSRTLTHFEQLPKALLQQVGQKREDGRTVTALAILVYLYWSWQADQGGWLRESDAGPRHWAQPHTLRALWHISREALSRAMALLDDTGWRAQAGATRRLRRAQPGEQWVPVPTVFVIGDLRQRIIASPDDVVTMARVLSYGCSSDYTEARFFGVETFARDWHMSESAARRQLQRAERQNLLVIEERPGQTSLYSPLPLTRARLESLATAKCDRDDTPVIEMTPRDQNDTSPVTQMTPPRDQNDTPPVIQMTPKLNEIFLNEKYPDEKEVSAPADQDAKVIYLPNPTAAASAQLNCSISAAFNASRRDAGETNDANDANDLPPSPPSKGSDMGRAVLGLLGQGAAVPAKDVSSAARRLNGAPVQFVVDLGAAMATASGTTPSDVHSLNCRVKALKELRASCPNVTPAEWSRGWANWRQVKGAPTDELDTFRDEMFLAEDINTYLDGQAKAPRRSGGLSRRAEPPPSDASREEVERFYMTN